MNEYYDINLSDEGAYQLYRIIQKHETKQISHHQAFKLVDELIVDYPQSPQLRISKALFSMEKYITDKFYLWEKAIELDPGFYDSYRRLSQGQIASAWSLNDRGMTSRERVDLKSVVDGLLLQYGNDAPEYIIKEPKLYDENWEERYVNGILTLEEGLEKIDRDRYPQELLDGFERDYQMFKEGLRNEDTAKFLIFGMSMKLMR